jgi:hypothetical protein
MKRISPKIAVAFGLATLIGLTAASSQTTSPFFRLTPDGKVGIGTANPGYRLDVVGDINLTGCVRKGNTVLAGAPCVDAPIPPGGGPGAGGLPGRVAALEQQLQQMATQMADLRRRVGALEARR